jgi:hypothetical protein
MSAFSVIPRLGKRSGFAIVAGISTERRLSIKRLQYRAYAISMRSLRMRSVGVPVFDVLDERAQLG